MSVSHPFKLAKIPSYFINFRAPLPWDVYDHNGLLYATKGTVIGELTGLFEGLVLFFDEKHHPSNQLNAKAIEFNFPKASTGLISGEDCPTNPLYKFTCDKSAALSDQIDSAIRHLARLLNNYQADSAWAHAVYQYAQALAYLIDLNAPAVFLALYVRRAYFDDDYPAAQAVMRGVICWVSSKYITNIKPADMLSALCASLTCDLSIYPNLAAQAKNRRAVVLSTADKDFLKEHGKKSYEMLKAAGIVDSFWLFIARRHERPVNLTNVNPDEESARLYLLNDFVYFSDIAAARCAYRKDRPALPLFNSIANVSFDSSKTPIFTGCQLAKIFGVPPLGSLVRTNSGVLLMLGPDRGVFITNESFELKANYKLQKNLNLPPGSYTVLPPSLYSNTRGLILRLVDSFGLQAKFAC